MSSALNGSLAIQRFEGSDAIEIHDGITFDFYTRLPHIYILFAFIKLHRNGGALLLCIIVKARVKSEEI